MSKFRYLVKKTAITLGLIYLVASGLFLFFRLMPGSFLDYVAVSGAGPEELEALRAKWGLDDPLYIQYFDYISNLFQGDMGTSFRFSQPVLDLVLPRMVNSLILIGPAITLSYIIGSLYGGAMGMKRGSVFEKYGIIPVTVFGTVPEFFLGIVMIAVFGVWFGFFPAGGMVETATYQTIGEDAPFWAVYATADFWHHYILPFLTVLLLYLYLSALVMRTSVVEVSGQDFSYYHRIKGLSKYNRARHIMKHASLPVITLFPSTMTRAIGGMVLIETVFNWPGIGSLLVESVLFRDYPVVQFVFFIVAVWVIIGNYIVDILYGVIDPRVSVEGAEET
jgi:peptide/nickel transport system permease protein